MSIPSSRYERGVLPTEEDLDLISHLAGISVALWRQGEREGIERIYEYVLERWGVVALGVLLASTVATCESGWDGVAVNGPLEGVRDRVQAFLRAALAGDMFGSNAAWNAIWDADDGREAVGHAAELALIVATGIRQSPSGDPRLN